MRGERKKKKKSREGEKERKLRLFMETLEREGGATRVTQKLLPPGQLPCPSRLPNGKRCHRGAFRHTSCLRSPPTNTNQAHTQSPPAFPMYSVLTWMYLDSYTRLITTTPLSEAISRQTSHQSLCETPGCSPFSCVPSVKVSHANQNAQPCPPRTGVVRLCDTTEKNRHKTASMGNCPFVAQNYREIAGAGLPVIYGAQYT